MSRVIDARARKEIDAAGCLVTPPFVDSHFHMDSALSFGQPRVNRSGTLLEGIQLWGDLKPQLTVESIQARARKLCQWAIARGTLAIRSHVDVGDPQMLAVQALLDIRTEFKPFLDLQLVAFPQDGYFRLPANRDNMVRALDMGVDVVGGIPHFERTMAAGAESVAALCELAARRGLMVDLHCDESDDPLSRHIEDLSGPAAGAEGPGDRLAPDVHALHGQLLRQQTHSADGRSRGARGRQPPDQHHPAGPARHLPQAPGHDPGERADAGRRERRLRTRLRHGSLVPVGGCSACSMPSPSTAPRPWGWKATGWSRGASPTWSCSRPGMRWRRCA
ncbi:MAG: amidohydrolase family protein [Desulfobacterales bacterium]|nr:amidohydrolase family protein [Desulfobacterales bacterium]